MNQFIKAQIYNITAMAKTFNESCKLSAKADDNKISKEEQRLLRKIDKITSRFIKELKKLSE